VQFVSRERTGESHWPIIHARSSGEPPGRTRQRGAFRPAAPRSPVYRFAKQLSWASLLRGPSWWPCGIDVSRIEYCAVTP
jgi:hypothetical protein